MNPWETLNIEPTDDKKVIKKAYAVLIKQYKPDEHPEKFKEIQEAYQSALAIRQWQAEDPSCSTSSLSSDKPHKNLSDTEVEVFFMSDIPVDEEQLAFDRNQQNLIDNLYKQLHEMAFAPLVVKNKLENWKFIEDFYLIDDLILKEEVARTIFKKVAEYNLFQMRENKSLHIKANTMRYFNGILDWSRSWEDYQNKFGESYFRVTIDLLDTKDKPQGWKSHLMMLVLRLIAFGVDLLFYSTMIYLIANFLFRIEEINVFFSIVGFVVFGVISELIGDNNVTIGKEYIGLSIVDTFGNICSKDMLVGRNITLHVIGLMPIYLWISDIIVNEDVFIKLVLMMLFINTITFTFYKQLFHDLAANSYVVKS